jgi:tetratricopeptide (TPR) repeat protein
MAACSDSTASAQEEAAKAQSFLEQNRIAEARAAISDAIAERDDEPAYHLLRGRIEYRAGSVPGAFGAYSNALALDPQNMEALQAVSQLGLQVGRLRESKEAAESILSLDPDNAEALLTRGLHSLIRNRYDESIDYADRILKIAPSNEGAAVLKARASFRLGDREGALKLLENFERGARASAGMSLTRLEIYRALLDREGMRRSFTDLRERLPDNDDIRIDEANFAFKDNRSAEAMRLTTGLLAKPEQTRAIADQIVDLWNEYGIYRLDPASVRAIASTAPKPVRLRVGRFLVDNGQASAVSQMLAGLPGTEPSALTALMLVRQGRAQAGIERAERVLGTDETNCTASIAKAEAQLESGNATDALRSAQRASYQCPADIAAWSAAATAYSQLGDVDNAERVWRQGMDANPQSARLATLTTNWMVQHGLNRQAVAIARKLTRDAPALSSGWRLYQTLCRKVDAGCTAQAAEGLAKSAQMFGVDIPVGQTPPNGLYGRLESR